MKNNQDHICGNPNGLCDAECMDKAHIGEVERANYYQKQMRQWRDAALAVSAERDNLHARIATLEAALEEEKATISRYQTADDAAVQLLEKAKMTLEVPAAEYVPAISDAWDLIELALGKIR